MPDLSLEQNIAGLVAGVDEAGRGPWAGPVVAAAVILNSNIPDGINDSKKLSAKKREFLFDAIQNNASVAVGIVGVEVIDEINILNATKKAMLEAVTSLAIKPDHALIDGNQNLILPCPSSTVIKGDSISLSIAAASIIAKVTRDRIMTNLHKKFPHYGWDSNSGYGTKQHITALDIHGVTEHHRKSYTPIRNRIKQAQSA
jgi:ribonuclease HII